MTIRRLIPQFALLALLAACKDPPKVEPAPQKTAEPVRPVAESPFATASASAPAAPPTTIVAQHILIAYRGAKRAQPGVKRSKTEAKKLADDLRMALVGADGDTFTGMVKKHSDDPAAIERLGSTGKVRREDLDKAFADAAFALKEGEISLVVETPFGFHIIKRTQ
ncbi:MAG: peptidylprolyl isomerase [Polyangiaceae bacterium]|nr:peptidylprolyl isomerase [Polyangiaceae bacterium]